MKKKVLIFIDWYLPGYKAGGPVQSVQNLVAHLGTEFDFFIITADTDYCETVPYSSVQSDHWMQQGNAKVFYLSQENRRKDTLKKLIDEVAPDAVYLNGIYSKTFTLLPLALLGKKGIHTVVAARGMLSAGSLSVKKTKKKLFLAGARLLGLFRNITFHATNEDEKMDIAKVFSRNRIIVAPNLSAGLPSITSAIPKEPGSLKLVSVARIAPEKNLLLALRSLSEVKQKISFDIYGPCYNEAYWQECMAVIRDLPSNIEVRYHGSIEPDKVNAVLSNAHFLFMPSTGENFGHIILQSFAAGRPVIISRHTPWKSLQSGSAGWDIDSDDPSAYTEAVTIAAGMNQEEYDRLSIGSLKIARNYVHDEAVIAASRSLFM